MQLAGLRFVAVCGVFLIGIAATAPRLLAEPIAEGDTGATSETGGAKTDEVKNTKLSAAIARFKERDFDGALKLLTEAADEDSDLPPAQLVLAKWFSQANIPEGVQACLEKATYEVPNDPEAYVALGDGAIRAQRITEADLLYHKAAALLDQFNRSVKRKDAIQPNIYSGLAAVAEARGDWSGEQKELETWLARDPKNVGALQRLSVCRFRQKDVQGALEKLREAAKLVPDAIAPEAALAQYYQQAGDRENAKKWLTAALSEAPKDLRVHLVGAHWAFEAGDLDEAKAKTEAAMKLDPKSLNAKLLRGIVALFQKDYKTAEIYFESVHLQSPENIAAGNNLVLALVAQKDEKKKNQALQYAETNARKFPKVADVVSTYGWVLYKLGRVDEAEQALRAASSLGSLSPDTKFYIARVLVDRNREAEAKQLLEPALKTTGPFLYRQEAQSLLEQLTK